MSIIMAGTLLAAEAPRAQTVAKAGTHATTRGSAEYFTGSVRVERLLTADGEINAGASYVTFEPGARTNWHIHPRGQRLIVTSGVGLTQADGGPVVEIRAGDVITCPANVKHWHGASPKTAMTHLAMTIRGEDGKNVTWLEPVTDSQYNGK